MDFQLGKTAAVNIEIFPNCVSQYEKKACQKPANGRKAPTNFQQEAEAGQKFNGRKAYCHRNEQFFRKQAVCGNDAGKGAWVIKLGASGYKKDSAEQEAHKSAKPGGIKKQCPKECQGRPRNIGNFTPVNRIDGTESGQKEAAEKSVKLEAFAPCPLLSVSKTPEPLRYTHPFDYEGCSRRHEVFPCLIFGHASSYFPGAYALLFGRFYP